MRFLYLIGIKIRIARLIYFDLKSTSNSGINFMILITLLSMGILSLRKYKDLKGVNKVPPALFLIASVVFFIPFVGKITSGILAIIGGFLFFTNLNKLD